MPDFADYFRKEPSIHRRIIFSVQAVMARIIPFAAVSEPCEGF